jgi:hypothetical protein
MGGETQETKRVLAEQRLFLMAKKSKTQTVFY